VDIANDPVVYLDSSVFDDLKTNTDPVGTFIAQMGTHAPPARTGTNYNGNTGNPILSGAGFRGFPSIHIAVLSTLGNDVEAMEGSQDEDVHGDQCGWPVVLDANNTPKPKPSTTKGNAGDTTLDWIDAAPPGFCSVGVWSFVKDGPFYGSAGVVPLTVADLGVDLMIYRGKDVGLTIDWCKVLLYGTGSAPTISDFYSKYSDETTTPGPQTLKGLTVTTRMSGNYLFVFLEASASSS
jgi:hypothetical protein